MIHFDDEHKRKYAMIVDGEIVRDFYDEILLFDNDTPPLFEGKKKHCMGTCKRCGSPLFASDIKGYTFQCFGCYEDFFYFEQEV